MAIQPTSKNTKTEILGAYKELAEEHKKLETQFKQALKEKEAAEKTAVNVLEQTQVSEARPEEKEENAARAEEAAAPPPPTMEHIIGSLSKLRSSFGNAISELSAKLVSEASGLTELRRNIQQETKHLETLHDLKIGDDTLNTLIQEYLETAKKFDKEAKQSREDFERETEEKKKVWQKEQDEHERLIKERNESVKETVQREEAEYKYNLELQRKVDNEEYDLQQKKMHKELERIEGAKNTEWAEREKKIAAQEKEIEEYRLRVEGFPKELEATIKRAKEEGAEVAGREIKVKTELRAKEVEGEQRIYELKISSLEGIIEKQLQQIQDLSAKLDAISKQSQNLAVKAIEGASSAGSLQAVKEIVMEQAKAGQKEK
jgi:hypothetical protein